MEKRVKICKTDRHACSPVTTRIDQVMPRMSGPDLGQSLKNTRPDIHVMLMSGGGDGNLLVFNYGWVFIQKPFVPKKLVEMVKDVLHSPDRSQLGGQEFDSRVDNLGKS